MDFETQITFPDHTIFKIEDFEDTRVTAFQEKLAEYHGTGQRPRCDCRSGGKHLELQIRRLPSQRLILALMQNSGSLHNPTCLFYVSNPQRSGQAAYVPGVIEQRRDGTMLLRLTHDLRIGPKVSAAQSDASAVSLDLQGRKGRAERRAMTPLGLLHVLWEQARLNKWHPGFAGKRQPWRLIKWLADAADNIQCGQVQLTEQLATVVPGAAKHGSAFHDFAKGSEKKRHLVLVGIVKSIDPEERGERRVNLDGGWQYSLFLRGAAPRLDAMFQSYPYAANLMRTPFNERNGCVVALFLVTVRAAKYKDRPVINADIVAGALMETTADLIPVASNLELQVADKLVAERRTFIKPLRYDSSRNLVFPDFELLDAGVEHGLPMEVFGRSDEEYALRREEKSQYYSEIYGSDRWWAWIAAGPRATEMPNLPPKVYLRHEILRSATDRNG